MSEQLSPNQKIDTETQKAIAAIFGIGERETGKLQESIRASDGRILLLVHPYFIRNRHPEFRENTEVERYIHRIDKFIGSPSSRKLPIVILEEMASVKETSRQVRQLQGRWWSSRGVYIIPTYHGTPEPYMDQKFFKQRFGYSKVPSWDAEDDIWSITNSTFHALGIRKILLGGMNLNDNVLKPDDKSENALKEVIACVNQTWKHLQGYDEVEIASFAYPLNRKDIQKE